MNRLAHHLAGVLMLALVIGMPFQIFLAAALGAPLFLLTAPISLLLLLPLAMYTSATPEITLTDQGLQIRPVLWRLQQVRWDQVSEVKDYTLLPDQDAEVTRRYAVGRKNYKPAEGLMLVIPSLPLQYRATGFFAGEGFKPVIAVTNRSHTNYRYLAEQVKRHSARKPGSTTGSEYNHAEHA
jgi:hypothetical protein